MPWNISSNIVFENQPDLLSDHCDRIWIDAQIEVENQLNAIYAEIRERFHEWIMQLNKPLSDKKVKIEQNSNFSFLLLVCYLLLEKFL